MDGTNNWTVFHRSVTTTNQKVFYLNTIGAIANYSNGSYTWWHQLPGASLFYIGDLSTAINNGTNDMISYHWHDVPGLQKFGPCKGSGASAAPDFVELGFKPSIVWVKRTDNTSNWTVWDSSRSTSNPSQKLLYLNTNGSEQDVAADAIDILSNGFAIRSSSAITQTGSQTYIYCAWAEAPSFNLYGGQSNAR